MDNKSSNIIGYVVVLIIGAIVALGGYYFGQKNTQNIQTTNTPTQNANTNEPVVCENGEKECNCPTCDENKNYMQVFSYLSPGKGYNLYAFLNNQGSEMQVIEYKEELYLVEGDSDENFDYISQLLNGEAKFKNNLYKSIRRLDIKTDKISAVKLINSCRTDGAPFVLVINNDGTVDYYMYFESGDFNKNYFNGYKVKDITSFSCEGSSESRTSKYTLLLEDGTTKELKK